MAGWLGQGPFQKKRVLSNSPQNSLSTDFEQELLIATAKVVAYTRGGAGIVAALFLVNRQNLIFVKDKHTHGKKMARKGRTKVIYKGTFVSNQSLLKL